MANNSVKLMLRKIFLDGTSTFDAWLNASSFQLAQLHLTLPYSFAQLGLVSGILFQLVYALVGCWSCYMTTSLYMAFREKLEKQNIRLDSCSESIQWYEVLGGLLGPRWKWTGLVFDVSYLFSAGVIAIAGSSSLAYALNDNLTKRTWTIVLGGCFVAAVAIPRAQYYRIWSCIGIVTTTYTAWYLTIATISQGQVPNVTHTAPHSSEEYFIGATNMLYGFGGHALTVPIVDSMCKPGKFKTVYFYTTMYILTLTLPSAITVYWAFGDSMLHHPYALAVLPNSKFRETAAALSLIHLLNQLGFVTLPIFGAWQKLTGVHHSNNYYLKAASKIPVVLVMWFLAIMAPYIGLLDSIAGSICVSFSVYILPCAAHMVVHRNPSSRLNAKLPFWLPSWTGVYCLNMLVILWVLIFGCGLGGWSSFSNILHKIQDFGLFPKCYQC